MWHVTSRDGTRIAYEKVGTGPPLIILGGSLADHLFYEPLAAELAADFTVYNVDRRGRGQSGDTPPYDISREVEDVRAVAADAAGAAGRVHVYGHSAGSALALRTAAAGLAIDRLVLADPPFAAPGENESAGRAEHAEQAQQIERLNAAGNYRGSVKFFLSGYGLPDDALEEMLDSPAGALMTEAAQVLPYDYAMLGDGLLPTDLAAAVTVRTLVLAAEEDPATGRALVSALPEAELVLTRASTHELPPDETARLVTPFLRQP